jgi:hypothetical protein
MRRTIPTATPPNFCGIIFTARSFSYYVTFSGSCRLRFLSRDSNCQLENGDTKDKTLRRDIFNEPKLMIGTGDVIF